MAVEGLLTYGLLFFSLYFEVFLLVSFLERRSLVKVASRQIPQALPHVCVVVPCYNEERSISSTLTSLLRLDYPAEKLEIMVVDDGSTDATYERAKAFQSDGRVRVYRKDNGGKHTAMNFALARTNAELVGCLDADSTVEAGALREIVPLFSDPKIAAVTPGIHVREPRTLLQHMQQVEYRLSIFNRFMLAALGSVFITPGPFSFFRASIVRELGAWRYAHSTEDMEMALRIQKAGHLIANCPKAIVHTSTPATLRALFKQRVRWTYGWLRNAVDYRYMLGNRAYGNLGLIILPMALISIGTGIYFFGRTVWYAGFYIAGEYARYQAIGIDPSMPHYELFYLNTSALWMLIWASVALILILITIGSAIGTGSRRLPAGTPLFILFYSFLVPLWLSAAVVRAIFRTGVQWR